MVASDIPLVASLYLLIRLLAFAWQHELLMTRLSGDVTFYADGRIETKDKTLRYKAAWLGLPQLFVLLRDEHQWFLVWRDSLGDEDYWQLLMILKKEP